MLHSRIATSRLRRLAALLVLLVVTVGCPHRSPVWSPDGKRILLLGGAGEDIDKAASKLWLVDVGSGKAKRLDPPAPGSRFLAATWIDDASFLVFTASWEGDSAGAGTEKIWRSAGEPGDWKELKGPAPSAERLPRRLPVVMGDAKARAVVYPSDSYLVVAVSIADGKKLLALDPADLVGPGPRNGFIFTRPEPENTGNIEIVAMGGDLKEVWRRKYSDVQEGIAKKLGAKALDISFNDTSTSQVGASGDWVGLTLVFSDIAWKEGISGYHARLDAKTGEVLAAASGVGLSGMPGSTADSLWAVLAPDSKTGAPVRLQLFDAKTGAPGKSAALDKVPKEAVQGYAFDPAARSFALALGGTGAPALRIYEPGKLDSPRIIELVP